MPKVTSLQAPHRIVDAILRDSTLGDGKKPPKFRDSAIGKELDKLSAGYATPLLTMPRIASSSACGTAPGCAAAWGSSSPCSGERGDRHERRRRQEDEQPHRSTEHPRQQRRAVQNQETAGRSTKEAAKDKKGKPVKLGKDGKPSEANHGNVTPTISDGGFTIDYAEQTTVLSLPALRRLRFPAEARRASHPPKATTLPAPTLRRSACSGPRSPSRPGYDLRSRCILRAKDAVTWNLLGKPGDADTAFALDKAAALKLYGEALTAVKDAKLPIQLDEILLKPTADLVTLVKKSMEIAAAEAGEGE